MNVTQDTPDVWTCSQNTCNGHLVMTGPTSGQRMDQQNMVCTECGREELVDGDTVDEADY